MKLWFYFQVVDVELWDVVEFDVQYVIDGQYYVGQYVGECVCMGGMVLENVENECWEES